MPSLLKIFKEIAYINAHFCIESLDQNLTCLIFVLLSTCLIKRIEISYLHLFIACQVHVILRFVGKVIKICSILILIRTNLLHIPPLAPSPMTKCVSPLG